jgi:hypothetical protein
VSRIRDLYAWQRFYEAAVLETDEALITGRIYEAIEAMDQSWRCIRTRKNKEVRALVAAEFGIRRMIIERTNMGKLGDETQV